MALSQQQINAIMTTMSPARMGTYLNAKGFGSGATALDIYVWNALVSGAFFSALHICEIVMRNAIAHALELKYGNNWPWDYRFERTLSNWNKDVLKSARNGIPIGATGKVVAELTFSFWCKLFTKSQDQHIWNTHLRTVFPFMPFPLTVPGARKMLYDEMESLRLFRNRIAHHEPIFAYPLTQQQARIQNLISLRCGDTGNWLSQWETVSRTLDARPWLQAMEWWHLPKHPVAGHRCLASARRTISIWLVMWCAIA